MSEPYYVVGGTFTFDGICYRNGSIQDLTGFTVTFTLTAPDETERNLTATIVSAANGTVTYTTISDVEQPNNFDLTMVGKYQYRWRAVRTTGQVIKLASRPKTIHVHPY